MCNQVSRWFKKKKKSLTTLQAHRHTCIQQIKLSMHRQGQTYQLCQIRIVLEVRLACCCLCESEKNRGEKEGGRDMEDSVSLLNMRKKIQKKTHASTSDIHTQSKIKWLIWLVWQFITQYNDKMCRRCSYHHELMVENNKGDSLTELSELHCQRLQK